MDATQRKDSTSSASPIEYAYSSEAQDLDIPTFVTKTKNTITTNKSTNKFNTDKKSPSQSPESLKNINTDEVSIEELDRKLKELESSTQALLKLKQKFDQKTDTTQNQDKTFTGQHSSTASHQRKPKNHDNESDDQKAWHPKSKIAEALEHDIDPGKGIYETLQTVITQAIANPSTFASHYGSFAKRINSAITGKADTQTPNHPRQKDKRFRDAVWRENPFYKGLLQIYYAWGDEMQSWLNDLDLDQDDRARADFMINQLVLALSPSNHPLNPSAIKRAFQTGGQSSIEGIKSLLRDVSTNGAMPKQATKHAFQVGKDLGISKGAVVFRNPVLELIQYQPTTNKVLGRPVIIIPPQINKFYIFDLSPKNSLVKHALDSGQQVFIVSWRNPTKAEREWDLDLYINSLQQCIEASKNITQSSDVNLVSACAGGITTSAMLAYLSAIGDKSVHAHSMFVTALQSQENDKDEHSLMQLFVSANSIERARQESIEKGFMSGKALAKIFSWFRPEELVWNYWVNNYLLGKEPPSLDVLFWDNDSTRLPSALHNDFLDIYQYNALGLKDALTVRGVPINLKTSTCDTYYVAGSEDYIMPWKLCYESMEFSSGKSEFVLSSSGHIQSILRPPGIARTEYYTNTETPTAANDWLESANKKEGSWWDHWSTWLEIRSGEHKPAPETLGSTDYPPLMDAPGCYVLEK